MKTTRIGLDRKKFLDTLSWQIVWVIEVFVYFFIAILGGGILALIPTGIAFVTDSLFEIFGNNLREFILIYLATLTFFALVIFVPTLLYRFKKGE